ERLAEGIVASHAHLPRSGRKDAREDAHRGRLAGAVGTEEADDLALAHREADAANGLDRAEALRDVAQLEHRASTHVRAPASRRTAGVRASSSGRRRHAPVKF